MQIYKITNLVNGKIYVGKDHTNNPDYYGSGKLIRRAIKKYGKEAFVKEVIEELEDPKLLQDREKYWIKEYNSQDLRLGYNISPGGDGGDTLSNNPDKKDIISRISNTLKGRVFSEEHKDKLKANHNSKNPEVAKKISQKLKGRVRSEEHKEKIKQANLGKKRSKESVEKNRAAMRNSKWVYDPVTGEQKRIPESESNPNGWLPGRNLEFRRQKSESQKGIGYKYYRNIEGTKQKRVKNNQEPPKGWVEGRAFPKKSAPKLKIGQYSKQGDLIRVFLGYTSAEKETGVKAINITHCCLGLQKTAGGFIWKKL